MIIVTVANGQLGRAIAERLLERVPAEQIGVSVRDPQKARGLEERASASAGTISPTPRASSASCGGGTHGKITYCPASRAILPQASGPTADERALLQEWLDRIAGG